MNRRAKGRDENNHAERSTDSERFETFAALASDWYWETDADHRFVLITEGVQPHCGDIDFRQFLGKSRMELAQAVDAKSRISNDEWARHQTLLEAREPFKDFEYEFRDNQGEFHCWSISGTPVFDEQGEFTGYRGIGRDITRWVEMENELTHKIDLLEEQRDLIETQSSKLRQLNIELIEATRTVVEQRDDLERAANHDTLTGMPSLRLANTATSRILNLARRQGKNVACCFIDLDNFKPINDTYGHEAGDEVLINVARRILHSVRSSDLAYRIGGDEFVAIYYDIEISGGIDQVCHRLIDSIRQPVEYEGHQLQVGVSIGVALFPQHADTINDLKRVADEAMYDVKRAGKNDFKIADLT